MLLFSKMKIIAHRVTDVLTGKKALDAGVDFIEVDVAKRFLFPKFVIEHNALKGKLGIGPILASIFIPNIQKKLFLDLKHATISRSFAHKLSHLLKTLKVRGVRVCGRDWQIVSEVCHNNGLLPFYTLANSYHVREIENSLPKLTKPAGFSVHYKLINEDLIKKLKAHADQIWAWRVNDIETAKKLASLGVNGIIADDWKAMMKALNPKK